MYFFTELVRDLFDFLYIILFKNPRKLNNIGGHHRYSDVRIYCWGVQQVRPGALHGSTLMLLILWGFAWHIPSHGGYSRAGDGPMMVVTSGYHILKVIQAVDHVHLVEATLKCPWLECVAIISPRRVAPN